jgi:hypothetical protein
VLRQRHRAEDDAVVDADDRVANGGRAVVVDRDVGETEYQVPDDPRWIQDDGTLVSGDALIWGHQSSGTTSPGAPVAAEAVSGRRSYSWGQVLIMLAGATSLVFGIGAVALAGLAGPVTEPVVEVFTFDHTPLLGLLEIAAGAVLVLAGLVRGGRWVAGPIGVAAIVGGALILAELDWTQTDLAAEQRFGWVPISVGAAAYLGAMVPTKKRQTATR